MQTINQLCTQEDDYVFEKIRWLVKLSDGTWVYQDDDRPGCKPASAWLRLKKYVEENNLDIVDMTLQFRSHKIPLLSNAEGYYFSKGAGSWLACTFNEENYFSSSNTFGFYVTGVLIDNVVHISWWKVPELILTERRTKTIEEAKESLIINGKAKNREVSV